MKFEYWNVHNTDVETNGMHAYSQLHIMHYDHLSWTIDTYLSL